MRARSRGVRAQNDGEEDWTTMITALADKNQLGSLTDLHLIELQG